jgi:hypothetical protein
MFNKFTKSTQTRNDVNEFKLVLVEFVLLNLYFSVKCFIDHCLSFLMFV